MVLSGDFSLEEIGAQFDTNDSGQTQDPVWGAYNQTTLSKARPVSASPIKTIQKYAETVAYQRILIYDETGTPRVVIGKLD